MDDKQFKATIKLVYQGRENSYDLIFTKNGDRNQEMQDVISQITNTLGRIANGDYPYGDYYRGH